MLHSYGFVLRIAYTVKHTWAMAVNTKHATLNTTLLRFSMKRMLTAGRTVLVQLHPILMLYSIFGRDIVA